MIDYKIVRDAQNKLFKDVLLNALKGSRNSMEEKKICDLLTNNKVDDDINSESMRKVNHPYEIVEEFEEENSSIGVRTHTLDLNTVKSTCLGGILEDGLGGGSSPRKKCKVSKSVGKTLDKVIDLVKMDVFDKAIDQMMVCAKSQSCRKERLMQLSIDGGVGLNLVGEKLMKCGSVNFLMDDVMNNISLEEL